MLSRLLAAVKNFFFDDPPRPQLTEDEYVISEGGVEFIRGLTGGRVGRLILTNHLLLWDEYTKAWPLKPYSDALMLSDVGHADKTGLASSVFGGRKLRIRLRDGKRKHLWVDDLDEWIANINRAVSELRNTEERT